MTSAVAHLFFGSLSGLGWFAYKRAYTMCLSPAKEVWRVHKWKKWIWNWPTPCTRCRAAPAFMHVFAWQAKQCSTRTGKPAAAAGVEMTAENVKVHARKCTHTHCPSTSHASYMLAGSILLAHMLLACMHVASETQWNTGTKGAAAQRAEAMQLSA
eukprot:1160453-Pelagomonas_calceolata.AAC.4